MDVESVSFVVCVCPSVLLSACIRTSPTGRIYVKFITEYLYENLSRKSKFGYNRAKISDTLQEGQVFFFVTATLNRHISDVFYRNFVRLLVSLSVRLYQRGFHRAD